MIYISGLSSEDDASQSVEVSQSKLLLDGLIAAGMDEKSCLSRYQLALFWKETPLKPSSHLISRLRSYETLHRRCGPYTESYNTTVEKLRSGQQTGPSDCKYVVWMSYSGLGNRILTITSAFLYAMITDRVLLVDPGVDMAELFCEPFPEVSWYLPSDFPLKDQFKSFTKSYPDSYGNVLKNRSLDDLNRSMAPSFMYLHLAHDYDDQDKLFFCDDDQSFLNKIPWLVVKTNNYFVPSLFLIPSFEQELHNLFPNKETVFHFLGRYLLRPTNQVWGLITRYYNAYLAKADERVGIQIRVFDPEPGPFQYVLDQITSCTLMEKLLPETNHNDSISQSEIQKSKAVLMTSLSSGYFEKVRDMYWEYPTVTGEVIGVYQPSHEGYQKTDKQMHNQKALAEMYLLSLTDVLVTSSWSTFGYVAQGLGGLKPWILTKAENRTVPNPPCRRAISMEPCFHAPPFWDCKAKRGVDTGERVPHVKHCEDVSWGLKLLDKNEW